MKKKELLKEPQQPQAIEGVEFSIYNGVLCGIIKGNKDLWHNEDGWSVLSSEVATITKGKLVKVKDHTVGRVYLRKHSDVNHPNDFAIATLYGSVNFYSSDQSIIEHASPHAESLTLLEVQPL